MDFQPAQRELCRGDLEVLAIQVHDLHKRFEKQSPLKRQTTLKTFLVQGHWLKKRKPKVYLEVLKGISLQVEKGSTFGIIGRMDQARALF